MLPADFAQHRVVKGLRIDADARNPARFERVEFFAGNRIRSARLDGVLAHSGQIKRFPHRRKQAAQLICRKRCGRAAAEIYAFKP